jgi:Predicted membrane protein (DUF2243)
MPTAQMSHESPGRSSHALQWAGYLLGFAMGGFFDGILHQVLQWHHLLSGVQRSGLQDLRVRILADGRRTGGLEVTRLGEVGSDQWLEPVCRAAVDDRHADLCTDRAAISCTRAAP